MTGVVKMSFLVEDLADAVQKATERWRRISADPEAELPWMAHFVFDGVDEVENKLKVDVTIEFDRTTADSAAAR